MSNVHLCKGFEVELFTGSLNSHIGVSAAIEKDARGPYAGVYGSIDINGALNTAITIRTMIVKPSKNGGYNVSVQAGAGIVADSSPENEYQETINKAKGILKALACLDK